MTKHTKRQDILGEALCYTGFVRPTGLNDARLLALFAEWQYELARTKLNTEMARVDSSIDLDALDEPHHARIIEIEHHAFQIAADSLVGMRVKAFFLTRNILTARGVEAQSVLDAYKGHGEDLDAHGVSSLWADIERLAAATLGEGACQVPSEQTEPSAILSLAARITELNGRYEDLDEAKFRTGKSAIPPGELTEAEREREMKAVDDEQRALETTLMQAEPTTAAEAVAVLVQACSELDSFGGAMEEVARRHKGVAAEWKAAERVHAALRAATRLLVRRHWADLPTGFVDARCPRFVSAA